MSVVSLHDPRRQYLRVLAESAIVFPYTRWDGAFDHGDIWIVPEAGGTPVQVSTAPTGGGEDRYPESTLDGSKIVFVRNPPTGASSIRVINADGSGDTLVATLPNPSIESACIPRWRPDAGRLAFVETTTSPSTVVRLKAVDPDGTNVATLYTTTGGTNIPGFSYSPDGSKIVFWADGKIRVMNADGTGLADVLTITSVRPRFGFTSNTLIYYINKPTTTVGGYRINVDGTGNTLLGTSPGTSDFLSTRHFLAFDDSALYIADDTPAGGILRTLTYIPTDGSGGVQTSQGLGFPHIWGSRAYGEYVSPSEFASTNYTGGDRRTEDSTGVGQIDLGDV